MTGTRAASFLAGILIASGCGPRIQEFKVEPRRVCAGDSVRVTFKVRGTPQLLIVRRAGTTADTTRYEMLAKARGKTAYSTADVVTYTPASQPMLSFTTDTLGTDSLIARDTLRSETWPDFLRLDGIASASNRNMVVRHAGKEAVLGSARNTTWRGLPVNGGWELRYGLGPGEVIGDPASPPPARLNLRISLICRTGGTRP